MDTGCPRGTFDRLDAACDAMVMSSGGTWTKELETTARITLLCAGCYLEAKGLNGLPRTTVSDRLSDYPLSTSGFAADQSKRHATRLRVERVNALITRPFRFQSYGTVRQSWLGFGLRAGVEEWLEPQIA